MLPKKLSVGDLIARGHSRPRMVREFVDKGEDGYVVLAIRTPSWTKRPYTVYRIYELIALGYRLIRHGKLPRKKIDRELDRNIQDIQHRTLGPDDVKEVY